MNTLYKFLAFSTPGRGSLFGIAILSLILNGGCGTVVGNPENPEPGDTPPNNDPPPTTYEGFGLTGTVESQLGLAVAVTHVVAVNVQDYSRVVDEVDQEAGTFSLDLSKDQPWLITYINNQAVGEEMLVGVFGSETLDTLEASGDSKELNLGKVSFDDQGKSTMEATHDEVLEALIMSEAAAKTIGALDDVSLRYINPDIDGNGVADALEIDRRFILDFHNRFQMKSGEKFLKMQDLKNQFPPDDTDFSYSGSGIVPELHESFFGDTKPTSFEWTFDTDIKSIDCKNGVDTVVKGGAPCQGEINGNYTNSKLGLEVAMPPNGKYVLKAANETLTWNPIKVSDFSAGQGFLTIFVKFNVENDVLKGFNYKWMKKTDGGNVLATPEEIKLIVKPDSAGVSLKVDGIDSGKEIGFLITLDPEGQVVLSEDMSKTSLSGISEDEIKAGIAWSRVLENPGISYDDKLGMRFLFSLEWDR